MNFAAVTLAAALAALGTTTLASADDDGPVGVQAVTPVVVPAKTPMAVHLTDTVSSNGSRSGTTFYFVTVDPVVVDGKVVVAAGTTGSGTLILAGHAGYSGHEGDLTLRFDKIATVDGQMLQFNDQRVEINGRNRKVISFLGGFVPFVGLGAGFIRGSEAHIDPTTVIHTITLRPASTTDAVAAKI